MEDDGKNDDDYNSEDDMYSILKKSFDKTAEKIQNQSFTNSFSDKFKNIKIKAFDLKNEFECFELKFGDSLFTKQYYVMNGIEFKRLILNGKIIFYVLDKYEINSLVTEVDDNRFYFVELL